MVPKKSCSRLLLDFLRIGCFTFGGGWSIVAQMQQKYVDQEQLISSEDLMDMTSVAKSLPGVMITNIAMLFGYHCAGLLGGMICVLGLATPPTIIMMIVGYFYQAFRTSYWVAAAMSGMKAAVVPVILSAAAGLAKSSVQYPPCLLVVLGSLALSLLTDMNPVILVIAGVFCGLVIGSYYESRGGAAK